MSYPPLPPLPPPTVPFPPDDRAYRFRPKTRLDRCAEVAACLLLFWLSGLVLFLLVMLPLASETDDSKRVLIVTWCGALLLVWPAVIALDLRRLRQTFWRRFVAGVVIAAAAVPTTVVAIGIALSFWQSDGPTP